MSIEENLRKIRSEIPENVSLVAISKTKTIEEIMQAYNAGQRIFGENKVQELMQKCDKLPNDIKWHLVGHLQSNKVKYIASFIDLIHSVDSFSLLYEINKQAIKHNRIIKCLLQIHVATEDTKFGLSENELYDIIQDIEFSKLTNIQISGLMGMATFTDNTEQIREEFRSLKKIYLNLKTGYFKQKSEFVHLSMGMSSDYKIAIAEGSTMVRIGSKIFGERDYT